MDKKANKNLKIEVIISRKLVEGKILMNQMFMVTIETENNQSRENNSTMNIHFNGNVELYSKLNAGLKWLNGICSMRHFVAEN